MRGIRNGCIMLAMRWGDKACETNTPVCATVAASAWKLGGGHSMRIAP